jgi:hypothetical protein
MFERILRAWFDVSAVLLLLAILALPSPSLTDLLLHGQDLGVLVGVLCVAGGVRLCLALCGGDMGLLRSLGSIPLARMVFKRGPSPLLAPGLALLTGAVAIVGAGWVYHDYALSLDEFMARFDAGILGHGAPMAALPLQWRSYGAALQPLFVRFTPDGAFWSSTYLPVNAALRGLAGILGRQDLVSPLLAVVSVVATHGVARRLWPDRRGMAVAAAVLLATSSQFLITAMTTYAMTAHLAFNLVWLWLFLRGGRLGHLGALLVGFLACGLHQLAFHPLFVAPFVLQLWLERRWSAAILYTVAYAGFCLFWINYDGLARLIVEGPGAAAAGGVGGGSGADVNGFGAQAAALLGAFDPARIGLMAKNLIRFATWQNPLTPPLLVVGALGALGARGAVRSLVLGLILTTLAVFVILPYQGHGWGYRYLHGLLGSVCLLAVWAWRRLEAPLDPTQRRGARLVFAAVAAISLLVSLPIRALQTHDFVTPYARADQAIRHAPSQVVLVDDRGSMFTVDLVRNDPFLRSRPLVFYLAALNEAQIGALCAQNSVSLFDRADAARFGIPIFRYPTVTLATGERRAALKAARCGPGRLPIRDLGGYPLD